MTNHEIQAKIDTARSLLYEALSLFEQTNYDESERCAKEALALLEPFAEREDLGEELDALSQKHEILAMLAWAYNRLMTFSDLRGDYALGLNQAEIALSFSERIGNRIRKAALFGNIGLVYQNLMDYDKALEYYQLAMTIYEELGDQNGIAGTLDSFGLVHQERLDYDKALEYALKAIAMYEESGNDNKEGIATSYGNIGWLYSTIADYPKALEYMHKSLALFQELGLKYGIASNFDSIGQTYAAPDFEGYDLAKAEEYLLKAIAIVEEYGMKRQVYEYHKNLAEIYEREKRWEDFARHFRKYHDTEKEVQSEEAKKEAILIDQRHQAAEREKHLLAERARAQATEELLHKTLPKSIADRVIKGETRIADHFESASVLFADVVGFTKISSKMPPAAVLGFMNYIFEHFDTIAAQYGCERIKTIGDGYMAVCGAPVAYPNHVERVALMASDMMQDIQLPEDIRIHLPADTLFHLRIGLHCGEITAGLIGTGKLAYDIYGDAVNTASRMESHGEQGKIHVSEEFKQAVETLHATSLQFIRRGEMDIKGKGMMTTYFLEKI
ncbi:MAG: tetratricopeptide repeat protein [Ignavibacteria bacterium]|nr:tetratricopeptide repeat protein [Ignavibacteria bacterium]